MKKSSFFALIRQLAGPIGMILVGAFLAVSPDTLSALIARFLGWGILLVGIGFVVSAVVSREGTVGKILWAMVAFAVGSRLVRHPLALASQMGIFLGILLVLRGGRDALRSQSQGRILAIATAVVGVVLLLSPLTATRLVFSLCGVAMVVVGVVMILEQLKSRRYLDGGDKHDIIDAL